MKHRCYISQNEFLHDIIRSTYEYRNIDGSNNNKKLSNLGAAETQLKRIAPPAYADGLSDPAGATRPSPREISNEIFAQDKSIPNSKGATNMFWLWGQFIDHDFTLVHEGTEQFNIPVPTGDPFFDPNSTGTQVIPFKRSVFDPNTGTTNPRQQINSDTSYLDGSVVYGSDSTRSNYIREHKCGKLKLGYGSLLPCTNGKFNDPDGKQTSFYIAGDARCNEHIGLAAIHTLFVREHNYWAEQICHYCPSLSDEEIYQKAKIIVEAEIQAITFNEFLPLLLGKNAIPHYKGYNPNINAAVINEFAAAAFRLGHTLVSSEIYNKYYPRLKDTFFASHLIANQKDSISLILRDFSSKHCQELDNLVIDDLRNFLFGNPGEGGFDLVSLNIQRGRDHGLSDYNTVRKSYGLSCYLSFNQLTNDSSIASKLNNLYSGIDNLDLFVGGLVETKKPDESMLGELFHTIVSQQFQNTRDGDRFWYENRLSERQIEFINSTKLSDIIKRNTDIKDIQSNVFVLPISKHCKCHRA